MYEYFLKDYLVNTRVVHDQTGTVIQQTDYYPFGLEINRKVSSPKVNYTYNGKEWQQETGHYDYGARPYDPVIARWNMVDPLADMYLGISPYAFTANNPINNREIDGRYFEEGSKSERQAARIERRADNRADRLERKADRLEAKGKSIGDLRDRSGELRQSAQDVRDMRNDQSTEYKYAKLNSKRAKSLGVDGPSTTITGQNTQSDNVVTMFTEKYMGNQIHETRHGGQNARGELDVTTGAGYGVADEVSAYRAQYSWSGKLQYIPFTDFSNGNNMMQMLTQGIQGFIQNITNINQITPNFVNSLVDNPGLSQILIYPPLGIPLNIWNSN